MIERCQHGYLVGYCPVCKRDETIHKLTLHIAEDTALVSNLMIQIRELEQQQLQQQSQKQL
jgi:hypothetical protein